MIPLNVEQHLGRKAFFILLSRRLTLAFVFLIITIVLILMQGAIVNLIAGGVSLAGPVSGSAGASIASAVNFILTAAFFFTVLLFIFGFLVSVLEYRNYAFTLEEFDLKMRRGVMDRRIISVPYRQIQDVDIERNLAHQLLGLSKLVMTTAGHEETDEKGMVEIVLEPIDKGAAEEIRLKLQREIGVQVVEGEKEADKEAS